VTPARTLDEVMAGLADGRPWRREPMDKHEDSLSGSTFESVVVEPDERYVVKHIARDLDWIMRVLGDGADGTRPRALIMWAEGLLAALPPVIDPVIVGMAYDGRLLQVMRDVRGTLVPPGPAPVPLDQHRRFLDHMAAMHAAYWDFADPYGLTTPVQRYGFAHPSHAEREPDAVPAHFPAGWAAVGETVPEAAALALALTADPRPLARAMADGPHTLVHGDWKYGNLGSHPDGRTVLLDWAWPGRAGPCVDLAWYLAVNCDRLPESKEDSIVAYRTALEHHGIRTGSWWDRHLELALLGAFLQLGWSKAGNPAELRWWTDRALPAARGLSG
jgi:aminoglycoside phosphotransferase (APT) family kinase protein